VKTAIGTPAKDRSEIQKYLAEKLGPLLKVTGEEVTAAFRRICPEDPLRYDFAISHYGMVHGWDNL
jgi:hypothetical protein